MTLLHRVTGTFWRRMGVSHHDVLADPGPAYHRTMQLVRVTYAVWVYVAFGTLQAAEGWIARPPATLLWPDAWMTLVPWTAAVVGVVGVFLVGTVAAALVPTSRVARLMAFVGILTAQGLKYSDGKINHSFHLWVLAALLLVFLPRGHASRDDDRRSTLEIAWGVQATILVSYTLAGLQKLWGAAEDLVEDGHTVFSTDSLALHLAKVQLRGVDNGVLAPFVLDHAAVSGLAMVAALVLELSAITLLFRPRAQRLFAVAAIAMHVGIGLVMNIWFDAQVFVVAVWLLGTPFVAARSSTFPTLYELPLVGAWLASRVAARTDGDTVTVFAADEATTVPDGVARADVDELGLPPDVTYAVRHEVRGGAVLIVGARARLWVRLHAHGWPRREGLRLLVPAWLPRGT